MKSDIIISLILFGVSESCVDLWVEFGKFKNIISLPNFIVFFFLLSTTKSNQTLSNDYVYYFSPFVHTLISSTFLHSFPLYSPTKPTTYRVGVKEIFWEGKGPWMWGQYGRRPVSSCPLFGWVLTLSHCRGEIIKGLCRKKKDGCLMDLIIVFL